MSAAATALIMKALRAAAARGWISLRGLDLLYCEHEAKKIAFFLMFLLQTTPGLLVATGEENSEGKP